MDLYFLLEIHTFYTCFHQEIHIPKKRVDLFIFNEQEIVVDLRTP